MLRRTVLISALSSIGLPACGQAVPALGREPTTGLDEGLLTQAWDAAARLPRLHAMVITRDGRIEAERLLRGPGLDTPVNIKSASKSVLAAVAGAAIGQGVLAGPEQRVSEWLSDRFPPDADPRLSRITVGHLLAMQAGLGSTSGENYGAWVSSRDWMRYALAQPFAADPGGPMIYSTGTSHLLSAVLTRASGRSTLALARAYLGDPLDIEIPAWPTDPQGIYFGGNEMRLSPRALARFGELYRLGGTRAGVQILPSGWTDRSWEPRGTSRWTGHRYGFGWWLRRSGPHVVNYAWGYGGQMVFVVPDLNLTVVMTSDPSPVAVRDDHVGQLHRLLDDWILPAAARGGAPAASRPPSA